MAQLTKDTTGSGAWALQTSTGAPMPVSAMNVPATQPGQARTMSSITPGKPAAALATPATPAAPAATAPEVDPQDAYTKFNTAILDMLQKAQGTAGQPNLVAQQTALQQAQVARVSAQTPDQYSQLSPQQQSAIRSGSAGAIQPELDAVNNAMKSRQLALQNFEGILGQMRLLGQDYIANLKPPKSVIDNYVAMISAGAIGPGDVPDEVKNAVFAAAPADTWTKYQSAIRQQYASMHPTTGTNTSYSFGTQESIDKDLANSDEYKNAGTANLALGQLNVTFNPDRTKVNWTQAATNANVRTAANAYVRILNPDVTRINTDTGQVFDSTGLNQKLTDFYNATVNDIGTNPQKLAGVVNSTDSQYGVIIARAQAKRARALSNLEKDPTATGAGYTIPTVPSAGVMTAPPDQASALRSQLKPGEILVKVKFAYKDPTTGQQFNVGDPIAVTQNEYNPIIHQKF